MNGGADTEVEVHIVIPVSSDASAVESSLRGGTSVSDRRTTLQLQALLLYTMPQYGLVAPTSMSTSGYQTTTIVAPIVASGFPVYDCPYPENCIPANNVSTCRVGSKGPVCAVCESGFVISSEGCVACASQSVTITLFTFIGVHLVVP